MGGIIAPSFKSGYAHPESWDGMFPAFAPFLGNQGGNLFDVSGLGRHGDKVGTGGDVTYEVSPEGIGLSHSFSGNFLNEDVHFRSVGDSLSGLASFSMFSVFWLETTTIQLANQSLGFGRWATGEQTVLNRWTSQSTIRSIIAMSGTNSDLSVTQTFVAKLNTLVWRVKLGVLECFINGVKVGGSSAGSGTKTSTDQYDIFGHSWSESGDNSQGNFLGTQGFPLAAYAFNYALPESVIKKLHQNFRSPFELKPRPVYRVPAAPSGFIPYPNPRYALAGGMQSMGGGIS